MKPVNRDNLPHLVFCARKAVRKHWYTLKARLLARWWQIPLGEKCWFDGDVRFRRHPNSTIVIGDACGFNSHPCSNEGGVSRACMVSTLTEHARLAVGAECGFSGTVIACQHKITLGRGVRCGTNTLITDTDWHLDDPRAGNPAAVMLEDAVWLGINVTVLKGVTIGAGTVVGANSLVTRSLPAGVYAGGSPARVLKAVRDGSESAELENE